VDPVEYKTPIFQENIKKVSFVLADILGGSRRSTHFKFVCQINSVDDDNGEIILQGLTCVNEEKTDFIYKENDVFPVQITDIIAVLPFPTANFKNRKVTYVHSQAVLTLRNIKEPLPRSLAYDDVKPKFG